MAKVTGSGEAVADGGLSRGLPTGWREDKRGTRYYDIVSPKGALLIRVGNYHDPDVRNPQGFSRFSDFLPVFLRQVEKGQWASFVFDSTSFASISARKWHEYDLNEGAKDPRQFYGGAVDLLEEKLCVELPGLPCNVGVVMHVSKTKVEAEGTMVRAPMVPGRLQAIIGGAWPEMYRIYVEPNEKGVKLRYLQTDSDEKWQAGSVIGAPDGTRIFRNDGTKTWDAIWSNWPAGDERPPWHGIIYGEYYGGKSTVLASMLPKPCYVAMFDAFGKDAPYRLQGTMKTAKAKE